MALKGPPFHRSPPRTHAREIIPRCNISFFIASRCKGFMLFGRVFHRSGRLRSESSRNGPSRLGSKGCKKDDGIETHRIGSFHQARPDTLRWMWTVQIWRERYLPCVPCDVCSGSSDSENRTFRTRPVPSCLLRCQTVWVSVFCCERDCGAVQQEQDECPHPTAATYGGFPRTVVMQLRRHPGVNFLTN